MNANFMLRNCFNFFKNWLLPELDFNQKINPTKRYLINHANKSHFILGHTCKVCNHAIITEEINSSKSDSLICGSCISKKVYYNKLICSAVYNDFIKKIIVELKYHNQIYNTHLIAKLMMNHLRLKQGQIYNLIQNNKIDYLIPIPQHYSKTIHRGFSQSFEIANRLHKLTAIPVNTELIYKNKATKSQTELGLKKRKTNLRNSFKTIVNKKLNHNLINNIILIDDVYTTGSTINEVAKTLKKTYPNVNIYAWVFAKAQINI